MSPVETMIKKMKVDYDFILSKAKEYPPESDVSITENDESCMNEEPPGKQGEEKNS